jgi:uncharacterized protein YkwD
VLHSRRRMAAALTAGLLVLGAGCTTGDEQDDHADGRESGVLAHGLRDAPEPDPVEEPDRAGFVAAQARQPSADPDPEPEGAEEDADEPATAPEASPPADASPAPSSTTARAAGTPPPADPEPPADPAPEPPPSPEPSPEPDPDPAPAQPTDPAGHLAGLVADFRASQDLPAFERSPGLDEVARDWAQVLADEGALRHNPKLQEQVSEQHGCCRSAENVVHNAPADVDRAHRQLLDSAGHRSNLAGDYQRIGIGIVIDDENRLWGVQVFHGD